MASTLIGGVLALIVAIVFLGILVAKVPSIPLWIVVGVGVIAMVVSVAEEIRSDQDRAGGS